MVPNNMFCFTCCLIVVSTSPAFFQQMMKNFHEREKAATKIQTIFRGRRVRMMQKDTKKQAAAIKIQVCLTCKHAPWKCTYACFE
jgi:hypothetical protein